MSDPSGNRDDFQSLVRPRFAEGELLPRRILEYIVSRAALGERVARLFAREPRSAVPRPLLFPQERRHAGVERGRGNASRFLPCHSDIRLLSAMMCPGLLIIISAGPESAGHVILYTLA